MTSSNANGDIKQGVRLRKMSTRYFSFKWKTDSGESTSGKNSEHFRSSDEVLEEKGRIGFFKGIKKKLGIKKFCRSKRKINAAELTREVDDSGSSDRTVNQADEKHETEVNERVGMPRNHSTDQLFTTKNPLYEMSRNRSEERSPEVNFSSELGSQGGAEGSETPGDDLEMMDEGEQGNLSNLSTELLKLSKYGWYWGPISGDEADAKLQDEPDGAFLIRDSSDDRYLLTLSFKSAGKLLHARVEHSGGMFSLCNQGDSGRFTSVPALIDHSMNFSKSAVFCYSRPRYPGYPAFPVRLTKPVSRFTQVRSLQYLCRFVIRQNTRLDNIHKLPLPNTIKGYIEEAHY